MLYYNYMKNQENKKRILIKVGSILLSVLGTLAVIYFIDTLLVQADPLPVQFVNGYQEAAVENGKIAGLINSVSDKIKNVEELDQKEKTSEALTLIEEARIENSRASQKAIKLSSNLEELANIALKIESHKQKQQIIEAVHTELLLVEGLVDYISNIEQFLKSLSIAVVSDKEADRLVVQQNLRVINSKRQTISNLNNQFLAKVEQLGVFD